MTQTIKDEEVKTQLRELILNKNYFGLMEYVETLDLSDKIKDVFLHFNELNGDVAILDQAEAMVENEQSKKAIKSLRDVPGDAVLKGGRYDNLIEQFGKKAPSVGFAIVLDELMMALSRQGIHMEADHMDTMIIYKEATMKDAILRAEELRKEGKKVILERKNDLCSKADYERFAKEHRLGGILYFI